MLDLVAKVSRKDESDVDEEAEESSEADDDTVDKSLLSTQQTQVLTPAVDGPLAPNQMIPGSAATPLDTIQQSTSKTLSTPSKGSSESTSAPKSRGKN